MDDFDLGSARRYYPISESINADTPKPVKMLLEEGIGWKQVGYDDIVSIMPYREYGGLGWVTWFSIRYKDGSEACVNGLYVKEVQFYKEEKGS